jgi:hypothetical protein
MEPLLPALTRVMRGATVIGTVLPERGPLVPTTACVGQARTCRRVRLWCRPWWFLVRDALALERSAHIFLDAHLERLLHGAAHIVSLLA